MALAEAGRPRGPHIRFPDLVIFSGDPHLEKGRHGLVTGASDFCSSRSGTGHYCV